VTASTSELSDSSSDLSHAAEGFTFVEPFIKLALEEVIVELASLRSEERLYQTNRQP